MKKASLGLEKSRISEKYGLAVCGDVHGQFHALMELLKTGVDPSQIKYCFVKDSVINESYSVNTSNSLVAKKGGFKGNVTTEWRNEQIRQANTAKGKVWELL